MHGQFTLGTEIVHEISALCIINLSAYMHMKL